MTALSDEIKNLIIEALDLEDIEPSDINDDDPLFVDGLGLDSIDALELGVAIKKAYDVKIDNNLILIGVFDKIKIKNIIDKAKKTFTRQIDSSG